LLSADCLASAAPRPSPTPPSPSQPSILAHAHGLNLRPFPRPNSSRYASWRTRLRSLATPRYVLHSGRPRQLGSGAAGQACSVGTPANPSPPSPSALRLRTCSYVPSVPLPAAVLAVERLEGRRIWASPREVTDGWGRGERVCSGGVMLRRRVQLFSTLNWWRSWRTGPAALCSMLGEVDGRGLNACGVLLVHRR
jgi:hypothetical protein